MKVIRQLLLSSLFLLVSFNVTAQSLIIDTDMNADDAIALLYLFQNKKVDIKAITVEANASVHCYPALQNIAGLIALTKHTPIPVSCSTKNTLPGGHRFPETLVQENDELSHSADLLQKPAVITNYQAVALLKKTLQSTPAPIDILALGPLTNLAKLLVEYPQLKNSIRRICIMGGAVHVPGNLRAADKTNLNDFAEWNIYFDPKAASIVFQSGIPIYLIPLDVMNHFPMDNKFLAKLKTQSLSPAAHYLHELLRRNQAFLTSGGWYFWDPLAAVVAVNPSIAEFRVEKMSVLQAPENKSGATVLDSRNGANVHICQLVNENKFEKLLLGAIFSVNVSLRKICYRIANII